MSRIYIEETKENNKKNKTKKSSRSNQEQINKQ